MIETLIALATVPLLSSPLIIFWWLLGRAQARVRSNWGHHPVHYAMRYELDDYVGGGASYDLDSEQQYDRHDTFDYDVYTDTGEAGSGE